ncbi:GDP-mannose 4,6-dehydratase, partial [Mycobacterium tuberculosis]|nr:GDP-mannose 4,6-dehydratase [Mycobacterium tuberculosis]
AYYSVELKLARLQQLLAYPSFRFQTVDIANAADMQQLFAGQPFSEVIHLAAQAGVRYSLENPYAYAVANLMG